MTSTTLTASIPRARRPRGLVSAELLKLRKRRGLVVATVALTIVPVVVAYTVLAILHASDPAEHGPAGGLDNFVQSLDVVRTLGIVAAVLAGVTAGTADLRAGVFRELVVTGRSRLALFAARVPGGLALVVPAVLAAVATSAAASFAFAGSTATPSVGLVVHSAAWVALMALLAYVLALGVSSLVGSTGPSIAILLGWQLIVGPQLLVIRALGDVRDVLPGAAPLVLAPDGVGLPSAGISMSYVAAAAAIVLWAVLPLVAGAWRTATRDA
jgi:hypothetical protein